MPGFKSVKTFDERNTKVVEGYAGVSSATGTAEAPLKVEKVINAYGSCAGAGSGEFDVYRAMKRREQMRLELLEKQDMVAAERAAFEAKIAGNKRAAEERTMKNAEKRKKKKMKKKILKEKVKNSIDQQSAADSDSNDEPEAPAATRPTFDSSAAAVD